MSSATPGKSQRILSIDILRGLTIFTMIFVNDLASIKHIPPWMKHMPADADAMTFVDVVFPAFLFIVGMAIPFAIANREKKGDTLTGIIKHILIRTIGLLVLGVFMVNFGAFNESKVGIPLSVWSLMLYFSVIAIWNQYPDSLKRAGQLLRWIGIAILILMAVLYRAGETGNIHWLQTRWWGILGLIGWNYLVCSIVYLLLRKDISKMFAAMFFYIIIYIAAKVGSLWFLAPINSILSVGSVIGGHAHITTAGIILSLYLMRHKEQGQSDLIIKTALLFGIFLFTCGYLLRPLYGISKIYATPTWGLYSSAICSVLFAGIYWLADVKEISRWANFLKPAGSNPLLAYIMPDIFYSILSLTGISILSDYFGDGLVGIFRSLVFSLFILWVVQWFSRWRIRLQL